MAHVIAVAGKGGVGKTTLCGMLIQYLCEKGKGHVQSLQKRIQFLPECLKLIMRKCVLKMLWLRMMILIFLLWEELRGKAVTAM